MGSGVGLYNFPELDFFDTELVIEITELDIFITPENLVKFFPSKVWKSPIVLESRKRSRFQLVRCLSLIGFISSNLKGVSKK